MTITISNIGEGGGGGGGEWGKTLTFHLNVVVIFSLTS